jgi:hypothetical protein
MNIDHDLIPKTQEEYYKLMEYKKLNREPTAIDRLLLRLFESTLTKKFKPTNGGYYRRKSHRKSHRKQKSTKRRRFTRRK